MVEMRVWVFFFFFFFDTKSFLLLPSHPPLPFPLPIGALSFLCFKAATSTTTPLPTQNRFIGLKNSNLIPWQWNLLIPLKDSDSEKQKTDFLALIIEFLERGGLHPNAKELLSHITTSPYSSFFLNFGVEDVSVFTSPPSPSSTHPNPPGALESSSPSFVGSSFFEGNSFPPLKVEFKMGESGGLEQWTGALSKIPLSGVGKRTMAREIVQMMVQMGKGYEEAKDLVKGLLLFIVVVIIIIIMLLLFFSFFFFFLLLLLLLLLLFIFFSLKGWIILCQRETLLSCLGRGEDSRSRT